MGSGQVHQQQGFFAITRTCAVCRGEGEIIIDACPSCGSSGQIMKESELAVKVPGGIDTGQMLKVRGEGEVITDGVPGDLYVEIKIKPHEIFQRQDFEIICQMPITYSQAVLGGEVDVPTLHGSIKLRIPSGTPSGKVFRLKGKGIANAASGRQGDQHARTYVYVPKSLSDEQKDLLAKLSQIEGTPTQSGEKSFLDKVKDFFE